MTEPHRTLPADFVLAHGSHSSFDAGASLMEAVAYLAGEPHSDHPRCASPLLTSFGIKLNDRFSADERQLLAPLIPRLVGTRTAPAVDRRRAYSLVDDAIRVIVPMGLDARGWKDLADRLRSLAPITDVESAKIARVVTIEVRKVAYDRRGEDWKYIAAAAAAYAAAAYAYAAYAYAYAYAAAAADRNPIILASIASFSKAIAITEVAS